MEVNENEMKIQEYIGSLFKNVNPVDDEIAEQKEREEQQAEYERKRMEHYKNSGVGSKYLDMTLEDVQIVSDSFRKNFEIVKQFITDVNNGKTRTLWLCGNNGNGKTLLGAMICLYCWGTFVHCYDIEDDLKDAERFQSKETRKQVFQRYKNCRVLVIDEAGWFPSPNETQTIFHVLNDRYENGKSSVMITNYPVNEFKEYLGKAIVDRFSENCTSLNFTDKSYRIEERRKNNEI